MSNSLAIAAVTATLRNLLTQGLSTDLPGTSVTTEPLDKARHNNGNQLNLFLYQTESNAAWRNMNIPHQVKPGETGHPPLAVNLYYLITAYGQDDDNVFSHRLLGRAMSILHDHPLLGTDEIQAATETELPDSDLHEQIERVRITPQPLSLDEASKLWTTFQTQYRISAAYQVSVVLIESTRPAKTPLPVLARGTDDEGLTTQPDLTPPFPTLAAVRPPNQQPSARLGDTLDLMGHHLDGDSLIVRFTHPRLDEPIDVSPLSGATATNIMVQIPDEPDHWPAGVYTLSVVISRAGEPDRTTNELAFSLAPRILSITPNPAARDDRDHVTLTLTCSPEVWPGQRAALLLADREILAESFSASTDALSFSITAAPPGEHFVRLRLDGVDSLLVDRTVKPPVFDQTQKVRIT